MSRDLLAFLMCICCCGVLTAANAEEREGKDPFERGEKAAQKQQFPLPKGVENYLRENLPDYTPLTLEDYKTEDLWLGEALKTRVKGDFDGNGKEDVVLLVKNKEDKVFMLAVHAQDKGYKHFFLEKDIDDVPSISYLDIRSPGPTEVSEDEHGNAVMQDMKNPSVFRGYFEKDSGDTLYYWENGKYESVYVGL